MIIIRDLMLIIIIRDHTPIIIIRDLYNDHYHTRSRIMELGSWNSDHGILSYREHISNHTSPPVMPTIFATSVALHASINHHFPDLESQSFHVNQPDKHCIVASHTQRQRAGPARLSDILVRRMDPARGP
jgi:hypothetical protein